MAIDPNAAAIAHAIQLSTAPVFLLTGIAGLLNVMATRLARIVDRGRRLEERWPQMSEAQRATARRELSNLEQRRKVCSWSINYCTAAALLVCLVIVSLFIESFLATPVRWAAGAFFVLALLAVVGGLLNFLREVYMATEATAIEHDRWG
jgi:uncharacterized membrane protein (DUF485 family)